MAPGARLYDWHPPYHPSPAMLAFVHECTLQRRVLQLKTKVQFTNENFRPAIIRATDGGALWDWFETRHGSKGYTIPILFALRAQLCSERALPNETVHVTAFCVSSSSSFLSPHPLPSKTFIYNFI